MNIVITGASKGMGKAFAKQFSKENNTLFLCSRNINELEETAKELCALNQNVKIFCKSVDVSIKEQVLDFAIFCLKKGATDIIINNAGTFTPGSIYDEAEGVIDEMMSTNFLGAYHLTRILLPKMIEKKSGHIFNICSVASIKAYTNGGSYGISKHAMLGFSKNLREELKPFNIKVTSIIPGAVYTDSWKESDIDENRMMDEKDVAVMVYASTQLSQRACVEEIVMRPQLGDL